MRNCLFLLGLWACEPGSHVASPDATLDSTLPDMADARVQDAMVSDVGRDAAIQDARIEDTSVVEPDGMRPQPRIRWPWPVRDALRSTAPFAQRHPAVFERMTRWTARREDITSRHDRGAFGVGNGRVFALAGLAEPFNTLHGLTGPRYDRPSRFFGDYAVVLEGQQARQDVAGRSLSAPVLVTRLVYDEAVVWTHDFAAPAEGPAGHCLVRQVHVEGLEAATVLTIRPHNRMRVDGARLIETVDDHHLTTGWLDAEGVAEPDGLRRTIGPGGWSGTVLHCFGVDAPVDLPALDVDAAVQGVLQAARTRAARRARLELPDPMVADLLDGWLQMIDVQTASSGAVSPMSRYTRFWTRDTMGPLLAFLAIGDHEAATRLLDALYVANLRAGEMRNSYGSAVDLQAPLPEVDWDAQPPLTGRVASESPSYLLLMHAAWFAATGAAEVIAVRWSWLRRALLAQADDDGWLPFSGDETFRLALNLTLGLGFEYPHERTSWSANSSVLWLAAQRAFAALATALERPDERAESERRAAPIEARLTDSFAFEDGCWASRIEKASGEKSAPFEDAQLKAVWAGWLDGDDSAGRTSVDCLLARIGLGPGVVQSPLAPQYAGIGILPTAAGVRTGMLPGYLLAALTRIAHPEAFSAFAALETVGPKNGSIAEYHGAPGGEAITLVMDPSGANGDSGARFRPWEGGIVYAAAVEYLFGWRPDAAVGRASLRPHLPPEWPGMALRGARVGQARVDVAITRLAAGIEVVLTTDAPLRMQLRWDGARRVEPAMAAEVRVAYGRPSLVVDEVELAAGVPQRLVFLE
jgi:hypothetical protein